MSQNKNINIVPETQKSTEIMQKRLKPTLLDDRPEAAELTGDIDHITNDPPTNTPINDKTEIWSDSLLLHEISNSSHHSSNINVEIVDNIETATNEAHIIIKNNICVNEFHLSNVDPKTTADNIIDYVSSNTGNNREHVKVFRLTKRGQDISRFKYVNFKIETIDEIANVITHSNFWPEHSKIAPFVKKSIARFSSSSKTESKDTDPAYSLSGSSSSNFPN